MEEVEEACCHRLALEERQASAAEAEYLARRSQVCQVVVEGEVEEY